MEMVNGDGAYYGTYHWNGRMHPAARVPSNARRCSAVNGLGGHAEVQRCIPLSKWDERYHEFAVEWDGKSFISFFVNAVKVATVHADVTAPTKPPEGMADGGNGGGASLPIMFDDPMYLMLQTALGGDWPGEPTASSSLPVYHVIDYVRYEVRLPPAPKGPAA